MHILIIPSERYLPKDDPLAGIFQQHQAQALKRAGYKVGVISPSERRILSARPKGLIRIEDDQGIPVFRCHGWPIPCRVQPLLKQRVRAGRTLFKEYMKQHGKPDLIHAHNAQYAGIIAAEMKRAWGVPYVLTEHSTKYAEGSVPGPELAPIQNAFKNAHKRLVVSPSLGHDLERAVGEVVWPWQWVPNILAEQFEKNVPTRETKKRDEASFRFLNIGWLEERKGQADLLRAFASQFKERSDVQLRIGGGGPLTQELKRLSGELGIGRQVIFLGPLRQGQVLAEMQACDAFVLASRYETFGVVLIEVLACGKPVISTACDGPSCVVRKENGLLVPVRDSVALAEAMATMRSAAHQYDSDWIRQDCIARFGERAVVGQLSNVYREVLAAAHNASESSNAS